jgi:hypothetical protein
MPTFPDVKSAVSWTNLKDVIWKKSEKVQLWLFLEQQIIK